MPGHFRYGKLLAAGPIGLDRRVLGCRAPLSVLLASILPTLLPLSSRTSCLRSRPFPMFRGRSPGSKKPRSPVAHHVRTDQRAGGAGVGHQEQPRSLRHHLLPLDARYPGWALAPSAAASALGKPGCDAPRASRPRRAPRSGSHAPCAAQKPGFRETPCLPRGDRVTGRMVSAVRERPEAPSPRPGLPLGWRGRGWLHCVTLKVCPGSRCQFLHSAGAA